MYSIAVLTFVPKHYTSNDINEMNSSLAVILWIKAQYFHVDHYYDCLLYDCN